MICRFQNLFIIGVILVFVLVFFLPVYCVHGRISNNISVDVNADLSVMNELATALTGILILAVLVRIGDRNWNRQKYLCWVGVASSSVILIALSMKFFEDLFLHSIYHSLTDDNEHALLYENSLAIGYWTLFFIPILFLLEYLELNREQK